MQPRLSLQTQVVIIVVNSKSREISLTIALETCLLKLQLKTFFLYSIRPPVMFSDELKAFRRLGFRHVRSGCSTPSSQY